MCRGCPSDLLVKCTRAAGSPRASVPSTEQATELARLERALRGEV